MIKFKKNKDINIEKNKNNIKYSKKLKKIGKMFGISAIFLLAADYSVSHYLDNKVNNIVSKEQREEFKRITDYKNRETFLNERLKYTYYTEDKYKSDMKIVEDFNNELRKELEILYRTSEIIKKNYPEYENFNVFFEEYKKSGYFYSLEKYYLYKKDISKDTNFSYRIKNNETKGDEIYYIDNFFWGKILDWSKKVEDKGKKIDYFKLYNDTFNLKRKSSAEIENLLSKDYFAYSRVLSRNLIERLVAQNEIPSFQLSSFYNNKIYNEKSYYKYELNDEKLFTPENVKKRLDYNKKSKIIKNEIDNGIDYYFKNKPLEFKPENMKNTLMILNAKSEYENNILKIANIKNENKEKFNEINYALYNYINIFNYTIYNLIKNERSELAYDNLSVYSILSYKNEEQKINYFLSGINNNNVETKYIREKLILETKSSDYYYK